MRNLCTLLLVLLIYNNCYSQNLEWVKQTRGDSWCYSNAITTDNNDNVISAGRFSSDADFDPSENNKILSTQLNSFDGYIQKLDSNGNLLWVYQVASFSANLVTSITTDNQGNIYATGYFRSTVDFDPSENNTLLTSAQLNDVFILKLNENGNFIWVKQIRTNGESSGTSLTLDDNKKRL